MRQIHGAINLIAFCLLVTEGYSLRNHWWLSSALKQFASISRGIFPGTLWCGKGHIARNKYELGIQKELDMCCRAHDLCDDYINSKTTKYGLYNKHIFCRRSLCECDLQFYDCLVQVHSSSASLIGKIYFKFCRQCFRTYDDSQECMNEGLDINEGMDRKGHRVLCAKFERNLKWGDRHNISTTEFSTWYDDEFVQPVYDPTLRNDGIYKSYMSIEDDD